MSRERSEYARVHLHCAGRAPLQIAQRSDVPVVGLRRRRAQALAAIAHRLVAVRAEHRRQLDVEAQHRACARLLVTKIVARVDTRMRCKLNRSGIETDRPQIRKLE